MGDVVVPQLRSRRVQGGGDGTGEGQAGAEKTKQQSCASGRKNYPF